MEDLNVVDYAQLAHMNRVRSSGGSRDETLLRYRAPVPRGPTWDGVVVDDRIVVEEVPKRGCAARAVENVDVIDRAQPAYAKAGLTAKESKRIRRARVAEPWGAHFDSREGVVQAEDDNRARWRLRWLCLSQWQAAIGLWTHVLLYRRTAFGLLEAVHGFFPPPERN